MSSAAESVAVPDLLRPYLPCMQNCKALPAQHQVQQVAAKLKPCPCLPPQRAAPANSLLPCCWAVFLSELPSVGMPAGHHLKRLSEGRCAEPQLVAACWLQPS